MDIFERIKKKISSKGISVIRLHSRYTVRQRTLRASLAMYQHPVCSRKIYLPPWSCPMKHPSETHQSLGSRYVTARRAA